MKAGSSSSPSPSSTTSKNGASGSGLALERGRHQRRSDPDHPAHGSKGECVVVPGDPKEQAHLAPSSERGQRDHSDGVEDPLDL
jgi:hypothetical protein